MVRNPSCEILSRTWPVYILKTTTTFLEPKNNQVRYIGHTITTPAQFSTRKVNMTKIKGVGNPDVAKWVNNTFRLMLLQGPRCKLPSILPSVLKGFTFDCLLNPNYRFFCSFHFLLWNAIFSPVFATLISTWCFVLPFWWPLLNCQLLWLLYSLLVVMMFIMADNKCLSFNLLSPI